MNRKFLLISSIIIFLGVAASAQAARSVPKGSPLQPIPVGTAPSVNQNVNSADSAYSQSQIQAQQQIDQTTPASTTASSQTPGPNPAQNEQTVDTQAPGEPIGLYWTLLIVGILGCLGVIIWAYLRFRQ